MTVVASAPAKVILFGEHAVNRKQQAVAAGISLRTSCSIGSHISGHIRLSAGARSVDLPTEELHAFKERVDGLRDAEAYEEIQRLASTDFFSPTKYTLAHLLGQDGLRSKQGSGYSIMWTSEIPVAVGLGSGAAASTAMVQAVATMLDLELSTAEQARVAWQGDVIAHGGVASGLDTGASTYGGFIRYTLDDGVVPIRGALPVLIVVGDTGVVANTAQVNERVRRWVADHPAAADLFDQFGKIAVEGEEALVEGDLERLGARMTANQELLREIGVSCPELERLIDAALQSGALGAKLAGSGGGGIMIALARETDVERIARSISAAGGRPFITRAGAPGARSEKGSRDK